MLSLALGISYLNAWTGAPGNPTTCPSSNDACNTPIHVGTTPQVKAGNISVGAVGNTVDNIGLSVEGTQYIMNGKLGIGIAPSTWTYQLDLKDAANAYGNRAGIRFPDGSVQTKAAVSGPGATALVKEIGALGAGPGVTKNFGKDFSLIDFTGSRKMSGGTFGSDWQAFAGGYIYKRTNGTFVAYITHYFVNGGHNLDTTEWCASGGSFSREWCFQLDASGNVIVSMPKNNNLKVHYVVYN